MPGGPIPCVFRRHRHRRQARHQSRQEHATKAGAEGSVVVNAVCEGKGNYGYNAAIGEFGNMVAFGVIDPAKVVKSALRNAASVAAMMLCTEAIISEITEPKGAPAGGGGGGGMGGMEDMY